MDINHTRTDLEQNETNFNIPRFDVGKDLKIDESITGRLICGYAKRIYQWWPTRAFNKTTQAEENTWRNVSIPQDIRTPLDEIGAADKAVKEEMLERSKKDKGLAWSNFERQYSYLYLWIRRIANAPSKIEILVAKYSVVDGIRILRSTTGVNKQFLKYGLPYMYDITIIKSKDGKTGRPKYSVQPENYQATADRVNAMYQDEQNYPIDNRAQFYSAADLELINDCDIDLTKIDAPITLEEVQKKLAEFPIDLNRRDKDDATRFMLFSSKAEVEAMVAMMNKHKITYLLPSVNEAPMLNTIQAPAQQALPANTRVVENAQVETIRQPVVQPAQPVFTQPAASAQPAFDFSSKGAGTPATNFAPVATAQPTFAPPPGPAPAPVPPSVVVGGTQNTQPLTEPQW